MEGTAQLKCGKANKKGIAKVSLTVTPFSGKKRKYASVSVDVSQGGDIEVKWLKQSYSVTIREGGDFFWRADLRRHAAGMFAERRLERERGRKHVRPIHYNVPILG